MKQVREEYRAIRNIKLDYQTTLRRERTAIKELKEEQRKLIRWIKRQNLAWVGIQISEPNSSGYRHCILDIHSPIEAYIYWADGGILGYTLLTSVFEDDFGNITDRWRNEVLYVCRGVLKLKSKEIQRIKRDCRTNHVSCCHTQPHK